MDVLSLKERKRGQWMRSGLFVGSEIESVGNYLSRIGVFSSQELSQIDQ